MGCILVCVSVGSTVVGCLVLGLRDVFSRWVSPRVGAPSLDVTPLGYSWKVAGGLSIPPFDSFDNVFPYVNAIANRVATVSPYAVDARGERVSTPRVLEVLERPNTSFSFREFMQFLTTSYLTQPYVDVLVWTEDRGEAVFDMPVTRDNVCGYTFLPAGSRVYNSDRSDYVCHVKGVSHRGFVEDVDISRAHIISLSYSRHPLDQTRHVAPAMTVKKWATVDDCIADYERGFFGNGAVPAGMMSIVSQDAEDFVRTKNRLEGTFRGAGSNNSVVYNMQPVDPLTNMPTNASKLTWTPFQQANNSLDLATLDSVVNRRLANALAVPDIIRGIDNGQTYANARAAERTFIEYTLRPLLLNIWDKWQFELDRITGGLGFGITFDLKVPSQTDEDKARADIQSIQVSALINLVQAGASPEDAAKALGLPKEFGALTLKSGDFTQVVPESTSDGVPDSVLAEVQALNSGFNRGEEPSDEEELKNIAQMLFSARETDDKTPTLESTIASLASSWADEYVNEGSFDIDTATSELVEKITPFILAKANSFTELGGSVDWDTLPADVKTMIEKHCKHALSTWASNMRTDVAEIRAENDSTAAIAAALAAYIDGEKVFRLADTEAHTLNELAEYYAAKQYADEHGLTVYKTWVHEGTDAPCAFCSVMMGTRIPLGESYLAEGGVKLADDTIYTNSWESMDTPPAHPHCHCVSKLEVA